MSHRVCPWWMGYLLTCPLRRWGQDPAKILAPDVRAGMVVLEPGPGMGFFTLELARLVGPAGKVVAIDIQARMLEALKARAVKAGLAGRLEFRLVRADSLGVEDLAGKVDLALAFAVVHEMPSAASFFAEIAQALKPGASLLLAEPRGHVSDEMFADELAAAAAAGLEVSERPSIRRSHAALLKNSTRPGGPVPPR